MDSKVFKNRLYKPILIAIVPVIVVGFIYVKNILNRSSVFTGYVVSDNVYMSSPIAATVQDVHIKRGQRVQIGTPLFQMDKTSLALKVEKLKAEIKEAESEKAVRQAELTSAEATNKLAQIELKRLSSIQAEVKGAVSQLELDRATESMTRSSAVISLVTNQIAAADSQIEKSKAELHDMEYQVTELSPVSPVSGRIEEVIYKKGEWAAANAAIVSIVPDNEIKVRFYIPQNQLNKCSVGTKIAIAYDGGPKGLTAVVDFIAARPEYTPPVIYSLRTRDKLVFMAEAAPDDPCNLIPGQPMDVTILPR
jgi:HlyD family secretion protein